MIGNEYKERQLIPRMVGNRTPDYNYQSVYVSAAFLVVVLKTRKGFISEEL